MRDDVRVLRRLIPLQTAELAELRRRREEVSGEGLLSLEERLTTERASLDRLVEALRDTVVRLEEFGIDAGEATRLRDSVLAERAEALIGRMETTVARRQGVVERLAGLDKADRPPELEAEVEALEKRLSDQADSLKRVIDGLEEAGEETAEYRKFLIQATGKVTVDILEPKVLWGLFVDWLRSLRDWLREVGPMVVTTLLILTLFVVAFRLLFRGLWWLASRLTRAARASRLFLDLVGRLLLPVATLLGLLAGLWFLGADPRWLAAAVGALGLVVGLALQDSLANLASGVLILFHRPYDVGEVIEAGGVMGKVQSMGLLRTTVVAFDNRRLIVPNSAIWQGVIENLSAEATRRANLTVRISYGDDIDKAIRSVRDLLDRDDRVLEDPEPSVFASTLAESGIEVTVWAWAAGEEFFELRKDLPRLIRLRFAEEGIEIPYPHRRVILDSTSPKPTL